MNMKKIYLLGLILLCVSLTNAQSGAKPDYIGHIEYTMGNFGTYNYPVKKDSILVYIKDSTINFIIFPRESGNPRNIEMNASVKEVMRKSFDKQDVLNAATPSGNYDRKYWGKSTDGHIIYSIYINHYGEGEIATMIFTEETNGIRLYNLFVAELVKFK